MVDAFASGDAIYIDKRLASLIGLKKAVTLTYLTMHDNEKLSYNGIHKILSWMSKRTIINHIKYFIEQGYINKISTSTPFNSLGANTYQATNKLRSIING